NQLIERLPRREASRLRRQCQLVDLDIHSVLCEFDQPVSFVYFPCVGFISLVTSIRDHPPLEMNLIGSEGMLGASLILGLNHAPIRGVVQGAGSAWRIDTASFRQALDDSATLRRLLGRYLYVLMAQSSHIASCTHFHGVEQRLARGLLATHDRVPLDRFALTHQSLADMLGVQRSAVTIAAGNLQQLGLISYSRGQISIVNRAGLEATSCGCYEIVSADYSAFFAPAH
ncbi:MAG: CRP-like cAMP-binding protein, partial [Candidatus Azotimanducaceae bacterium]